MLYRTSAPKVTIHYGHREILKLLIEFEGEERRRGKFASDWIGRQGAKALTRAILEGQHDVVVYLLRYGVVPSSKGWSEFPQYRSVRPARVARESSHHRAPATCWR